MRALEPGDHLDQYLIVDVIARTAMATTFKGHDTHAGVAVCLKVPRIECESDIVCFQRFEREREIALRLDHPRIVRGFRPDTQSRQYLVTEYVDGSSLRALIDGWSLSPGSALDIAGQLAEALVHLHAHGVVHRDLKPENVMITRDGQVKLIDFGIALDRSARRVTWRRLSNLFGTPDYMAPEQVAGHRGDERTDVYGVGLILYEMLTGCLPYTGDARAVLRAKRTEEPLPPTYHRPEIDPAIDAVICRAIQRDPRARPRTMQALLDQLRQPEAVVAQDEEPSAPPRPWLMRTVTLAAVLTLSVLVWLSGSR
jgi:serine/threonine-protein kinase